MYNEVSLLPDPPHNVDWFKDGQIVHSVDVDVGRPDPPHNVDWFKDGQIVHSDVDVCGHRPL